jgi:hypothetical protein
MNVEVADCVMDELFLVQKLATAVRRAKRVMMHTVAGSSSRSIFFFFWTFQSIIFGIEHKMWMTVF